MVDGKKTGSAKPEVVDLLQKVVDTLPQFIFWKDRESRYLGCNEHFAKIAGLDSPCDIVGKSDFDLAWKTEESEYFRRVDRRVMESGQAEYHIVEPQMQSNGKEAWLETNKIPLVGEDGQVQGILGTFEDITERKLAQDAAHHEKRLESIGRLAGGIAHDFNNLLGGIIGATEVLQRRTVGQPDQALLGEILHAAERAANLTNKLLAFSRRGNLQVDTIDLHAAIESVAPLLKRGLDARISLKFSLHADSPYVTGDVSELELALLNLCLNARDAMPQGGELVISTENVELDSAQAQELNLSAGSYLQLVISDTGTGISQDALPHIFEPFFTTKAPGEGTGLGLAAVYGAVQAHGGSISVSPQTPRGTSFVINLPLSSDGPQSLRPQSKRRDEQQHQGLVLLADDETLLRNMTRERLKNMGFDVVCASDGQEAVELFESHHGKIDLAILDLVMPRLTGFEVLQHLRTQRPDLPVVLISGFSEQQIMSQREGTSRVSFLRKPFAAKGLCESINAALNLVTDFGPVPAETSV